MVVLLYISVNVILMAMKPNLNLLDLFNILILWEIGFLTGELAKLIVCGSSIIPGNLLIINIAI